MPKTLAPPVKTKKKKGQTNKKPKPQAIKKEYRYPQDFPYYFEGREITLASWPINDIPGDEPFSSWPAPPSFLDWMRGRNHLVCNPFPFSEPTKAPVLRFSDMPESCQRALANEAWSFLSHMTFHLQSTAEVEVIADLLAVGLRSMLNELADASEAAAYLRNTVRQAVSDDAKNNHRKQTKS